MKYDIWFGKLIYEARNSRRFWTFGIACVAIASARYYGEVDSFQALIAFLTSASVYSLSTGIQAAGKEARGR